MTLAFLLRLCGAGGLRLMAARCPKVMFGIPEDLRLCSAT